MFHKDMSSELSSSYRDRFHKAGEPILVEIERTNKYTFIVKPINKNDKPSSDSIGWRTTEKLFDSGYISEHTLKARNLA
jgi:hypothetical protein